MSFRLVPKSVTLNDLERRNGVILRYLSEFGWLPGALRKSSRSLSHLLMSSCQGRQPACDVSHNTHKSSSRLPLLSPGPGLSSQLQSERCRLWPISLPVYTAW